MHRKITWILSCALFIFFKTFSQIPQQALNFQSPNAATMGLFGDVPVSYFTGVPQINIPLYTFKEDGVSFPLALNYHASGFRPDMHPGWVGSNWNVSLNYAITRSINDLPDDYHNSNYYLGANMGYYFNLNSLANPNWNQIAYMKSVAETDSMFEDTEPDEYTFSYPGGNGKFYLDHTGNWKVKCDKPVKVNFDNTYLAVPLTAPLNTQQQLKGNTQCFSGFTITDESGVQYVFGKDTSAIEFSMGFFTQWLDEWIAQAWYLTKIILPEGHQVNFKYQRDDFINQMYLGVYNNIQTKTSTDGGGIFSLNVGCSSSTFNNISASYQGRLISPVYLSYITGSNTKITFKRSNSNELSYGISLYEFKRQQFRQSNSTAAFLPQLNQNPNTDLEGLNVLKFKRLDSIQIETIAGSVERKFKLGYNNLSAERLFLKSVTEVGKNNEVKPSYLLFYDSSVVLPGYLANKTDHWGFYNGNEATIDEANYYNRYYNKRNVDTNYIFAGTLNRIVYPTGGVTQFIYEPNTYGKQLYERRSLGIDPSLPLSSYICGGLRIKKIFSYDINTDSIKKLKEYFYDSLGLSTGVLGGRIRYYFDDYRCIAFNNSNNVYSNAIFSSQSVLPGCNNAQGSHVGYSLVTERLADSSYTKYYYTNFDNGRLDESADTTLQPTRTAYEPFASLDEERGKLFRMAAFNKNKVLLQQKDIAYTALNKANEYVRALKCRYFNVCPGGAASGEEGTAYKIYTYSYLPVRETTTQYDQDGLYPYISTKYYSYNSTYRLLAKDSSFDRKGQNVQTYYRYPFDVLGYTPAANAPSSQPVAYMVQHNMIGDPYEIIQTKKISGSEQVMDSKVTEFANYSGDVQPYKVYSFKYPGSTVLKSAYTNYSIGFSGGNEIVTKDSRLELKSIASSYDAKGNLTDLNNDQDVNTSYQWDYQQNYPAAKVINANTYPVKQFFYQGFENTAPSGITPFAGNNCYNGDYTVPFTAPSGRTYKVDYRYFDGTNWQFVSKSYVNNMVLSDGTAIDEVRVYPVDAQMWTYTYDPVSGMTSENDLSGKTRSYTYDGLGRLTQIKDENKNILKQFAYNYQLWQPTGQTRCKTCPLNPSSISNIQEIQFRDNNPASTTYNQTRWVNGGPCRDCVPPAQWQNSGSLQCKKNEIGQNTGQREQQQRDNNPCSATYNNIRWIVVDTNTTSCPVSMTTVKLTSTVYIPSGTITFTGSAGTFIFNLYSNVTNYTIGSLPYGVYDVSFVASGSYTCYINGSFAHSGGNWTATGMGVNMATLTLTVNSF